MKFAVINDMHISAEDTGYEKGVQRKLVGESERLVKKFVNLMNNSEHPRFVVNLGDTIEDVGSKEGDIKYFKKAVALLSKLKVPVYYLIGNHDVKTSSAEDIARLLGYEKMYYSFDEGDFHFAALSFWRDMDENSPTNKITFVLKEELDWLKADLAKTQKPTVIFSHYGLADDDMAGNFWFEEIPDKAVIGNRAKVRKILEDSGKVKAVFTAHQHWNRMHVHNGIPYFTVTSLVENFNNDGVASEAHTIVNIGETKIEVEVKGNDPASYSFKF
jgi:3',5'-cyclic AMP phosphodiesterase CpdA